MWPSPLLPHVRRTLRSSAERLSLRLLLGTRTQLTHMQPTPVRNFCGWVQHTGGGRLSPGTELGQSLPFLVVCQGRRAFQTVGIHPPPPPAFAKSSLFWSVTIQVRHPLSICCPPLRLAKHPWGMQTLPPASPVLANILSIKEVVPGRALCSQQPKPLCYLTAYVKLLNIAVSGSLAQPGAGDGAGDYLSNLHVGLWERC